MTYKEMKNRIFTSSVILVVALTIGLLGSSVIARDSAVEYAYTPENLIRLHVIANSDSPFDQKLKLQVRDAILQVAHEVFAGAQTKQEALQRLIRNRERFLVPAQATVISAGKNYPVRLEVGDFQFPTKSYGDVTLPAGEYQAARFVIGEGTGQNWWCVLFPPLCLWEDVSAAEKVASIPDPKSFETEDDSSWFAGAVQVRLKYIAQDDNRLAAGYAAKWRRLLQPTLAWLRVVPTSSMGRLY